MAKHDASGLRILELVIEDKSWGVLGEYNIREEDFVGTAKTLLLFTRKYVTEHDEFPPVEYVYSETGIEQPPKIVRKEAIKKYLNRQKSKQLKNIVMPAMELNNSGKPFEAETHLITELAKSATKTAGGGRFTKDSRLVYDDYVENRSKKLTGVFPPFPTWRDSIQFFEDGTMNTILGISSTGKSYLSCACALNALLEQDKSTLLISMENPLASMRKRLTAMYHRLCLGDIRSRRLDSVAERRWKEELPDLEAIENEIYIHDLTEIRTPNDVYQKFMLLKPDFVIIDGIYKMGNSSDFKVLVQTLQEIQNCAAASNVPWVVTNQLKQSAATAKGGRSQGYLAKGGETIFQDSSTVLTITQTEEQRLTSSGVIECTVAKDRDGTSKLQQFHLCLNPALMTIEEFDYENFEDSDISNTSV